MKESVVILNKLSSDDIKYICLNCFDCILLNENKITKGKIIEKIRNLRDEVERYA